MPVSRFMAAANAAYYARGTAIGRDFVTAPEISQMFGEIIGACLADVWERAGRPDVAFVELGPGRGTLAADARRVMARADLEPPIHFIETSLALRSEQAGYVPDAIWHDDASSLPDDLPLLIVANEFFDALPVEQLVRGAGHWHQRLVACQDTLFLPVTGKAVPDAVIPAPLRAAAPGSIFESAPAGVTIMRALAARIVKQGGAALVIDYGYDGPALGETLQGVRGHRTANPFDEPGSIDLSAHVDFTTLAAAAIVGGARVIGPVSQRDFLGSLGIAGRAAALARSAPGRAGEIAAAHRRLTSPDEMGTLFRAMAVASPDWPEPGGFP